MAFEPTPEQKNLLEHDPDADGVLLAGPGTGKSATVVAYVEQLSKRWPRTGTPRSRGFGTASQARSSARKGLCPSERLCMTALDTNVLIYRYDTAAVVPGNSVKAAKSRPIPVLRRTPPGAKP